MNKKLLKLLTLIVIMIVGVVTLTGCSTVETSSNGDVNELEGLAVYTADEDTTGYTKCEEMEGVEFYYPSNYTSVGKSTQPMYMDPEILGASVNLVSAEIPSTFTFEGYIDASIIGIKAQMTINGDIKTEYINLNGTKAARLDYEATMQGQTMQCSQVIIQKGSTGYVLTIGSLTEDAEALKPKMEKMIKSLK